MRKFILIIAAFLLIAPSFGQNDKKMFELGDEAMKNGHYTSAVYYYSLVINKLAGGGSTEYMPFETVAYYKKPEKQEDGSIKPPSDPGKKEVLAINKLADAYREAKDYKNAVVWYKSAMEHRLDEFPYVQYFYGVSLMKSDQFEEAIKEFEGVKTELNNPDHPIQQKAENRIISCEFALNPNNTDDGLKVNEMDSSINAGTASFGFKRLQNDIFVFASARKNPVDSVGMMLEEMDDFDRDFQKALGNDNGKKKKKEEYNPILDPLYMLDIYKVRALSAGVFEAPEKAKNNLSMPFIHEADLTISKDGKTAYFTRMDPMDHRNTKIFVSKNFNGKWMRPLALDSNVNREGSRSMNPTLSNDGKTLYFSSNRPGGEGGMDIWMTTINEDGVTTAPQNLGTNINTLEDEISPYYDGRSKNMYFASEGHIGFGGFDIYVSTWNPDTDWFNKAKNMSAPINSSKDDAYYYLDDQTGIAYLSSDRNSCKECDEQDSVQISGNCYKIYDVSMPDIEFALEGTVYDEETEDPIPNPVITIKDIRGEREDIIVRGDENGFYSLKLEANWEIYIRAQDEPQDYFAKADYAYTLGLTESTTIIKDFYLVKVPEGEIAIEGIEYDFDSANLRPKSKEVLDQLYKDWIEPNPSFTIEIRSHTDFRGSDTYNMTLSQARAQSVVDYLTETYGVSKERLLAKGLGETEPTTVELPTGEQVVLTEEYIKTKLQTYNEREEAHQRNRRTAFKVIR
ncbi:MAG: PD40 domain-containing protein [Crocinitomicaceae bacterium]|nr:PD40 domain-containing protein [Crocinitomicaceae bacterium]